MGEHLSYDERCLIQHTLGLDRSDVVYRNFFAADPGHVDKPVLDELTRRGLMVRETSAICPDLIYRVTKAGKDALSEPRTTP